MSALLVTQVILIVMAAERSAGLAGALVHVGLLAHVVEAHGPQPLGGEGLVLRSGGLPLAASRLYLPAMPILPLPSAAAADTPRARP